MFHFFSVTFSVARLPEGLSHRRRNRQKRRQRSSLLLGDVLECRTSHLAARMIWRKVFGRIHSAKRPFFNSSFFSNHPGAKYAVQCAAWNSVPQTAATIFAFSTVCFFFYGQSLPWNRYNGTTVPSPVSGWTEGEIDPPPPPILLGLKEGWNGRLACLKIFPTTLSWWLGDAAKIMCVQLWKQVCTTHFFGD